MADEATVTAESSPAPETAPVSLDKFTDAEHAKWLETGETPKPKKAESATASPESAPESGTGKESQESVQPERKQDGETRKRQLAAEIQDLLEQRRRLREELSQKPAEKAESQPEAKAPERPKRPRIDEFEDYSKYEDALDQYEEKLADYKAGQRIEAEKQAYQKQQQQQTIEQHNAEVRKNWETRLRETQKRHPDFDAIVRANELPLNPIMDGYLLDSEIGPDVVVHLCQHMEEANRIAKLPPYQCARELVKLESSISEKLKATPAPSKITGAKEPPRELSGTNRAPEDEAQAALAAGDVGRYMDVMNTRDAARIVRK